MFHDLMKDYDGSLRMSKDYVDGVPMPADVENWKIPLIKLMRECFKAGERSAVFNKEITLQLEDLRMRNIQLEAQVDVLMSVITNIKG